MKHRSKDNWFADPFILNVTDNEIVLLVEEYIRRENIGIISKLVVNRHNYNIINKCRLLKLETHLSYPAIYRTNDNFFVYPENCQSGELKLYKYNKGSNTLDLIKTLVNEPLTDSIIYETNNKSYLFTTKQPYPSNNELYIYKANSWDGDYTLDYSILLNDKSARSAGNIFKYEGLTVRPAQDCNKTYGGGIVFQSIKIKNERFVVEEICRLYNKSIKYGLGIHTFNTFQDIAVVDVMGYKYPIFGRLINKIYTITKRITSGIS
ncbi:MAG: hypothetical protein VB022_02350 [Rikenellaceae bacterium]|nr:hypothetical protein [Rikenellaceae bacterium]